mgnify:FL=1|jgi:hypothetical protein
MKIKMTIKQEFTHGTALSDAMDLSTNWKNHISNCDNAQVNFLSIDGNKIVVNDVKNKLLDDKLWRSGLEAKSQLMLNGNREIFMKKSEILKSDNFSIASKFEVKVNQSLSIECACGADVNLDSNFERKILSGKEASVLSEKIGKMSYD